MKNTLFALGAAILAASALPVLAAPVINPSVFEAATPGGDYDDVSGAGNNNLGAVAVGQTTLFAKLRVSCDAMLDCSNTSMLFDPSDAFFFEVASGTRMTDLLLRADGGGDNDTSPLTFQAVLDSNLGMPGNDGTANIVGEASPVNLLAGPLELGEGTYNFNFGILSSVAQGSFRVNWTAIAVVEQIETSPVPLPASLPLLLAALGGVAVMRRRRG